MPRHIKIVQNYLDKVELDDSDSCQIVEGKTIIKPYGWIFFYNSRLFLETGDALYALAGNAPLIIDKEDGSLHVTGTAYPLEYYIAVFEKGRQY